MKYVLNKGRYAQSFSIQVKGRERLVSFDRRRVYMDTGNVATTGITEVEDDIYKLLLENKRFKALIASEEFVLTEKVTSEDAGEVNAELKAENESLKKALKEAEAKNTSEEVKAEMKAKDKEIKSLKAQLEALTKDKKADSETEGF